MSGDGYHRGFSVTPKDLIMTPDQVADEIMIGLLHREGGCRYEFALRWRTNAISSRPAMRLEIYEEAMTALLEWPDLVIWLATRTPERRLGRRTTSTSVQDVVEALVSMGFEDRTR
jgi:hypothetical protein